MPSTPSYSLLFSVPLMPSTPSPDDSGLRPSLRSSIKNAITSAARRAGSSSAAKCPPTSNSLYRFKL